MKDNSSKTILQKRLTKLNRRRKNIQQRLFKTYDDVEIIKNLSAIRSLDNERYRIFKQIEGVI